MGKWINADYIKAVMKGDRLMQGNCEYELWKQEVDKKVDAMPSIDVMDVVTAYQQGWCDALDASISALNDAKFQLGKEADRKTEPQYDFGEYADRLWKIAYERGKREALAKDEPQTCSVNGRPYDCGNCEYHKCMADEPQTERDGE